MISIIITEIHMKKGTFKTYKVLMLFTSIFNQNIKLENKALLDFAMVLKPSQVSGLMP